ncbi:aminotransferase [Chiua virens]|nr:aminotransferase [Chiua virens]
MVSFSLLCTTRFDPFLEKFDWNNAPDGSPSSYLLLNYQLDRFISSAHLNRWAVPDALDYSALKKICDGAVYKVNDGKSPCKVRVILTPSGDITASASPAEPLHYDPIARSQFNPDADAYTQSDPILLISVDTRPTLGTIPMKTTHRKPYDDARVRAGIPPLGTPRTPYHPDDVILFNTSGVIMETSICNVAFYREGRWFTPSLSVGCIPGVFRRWLLENGRIYETEEHSISLDTIKHNEWVLVFNGVMGCQLGRVCCDGGASQ